MKAKYLFGRYLLIFKIGMMAYRYYRRYQRSNRNKVATNL